MFVRMGMIVTVLRRLMTVGVTMLMRVVMAVLVVRMLVVRMPSVTVSMRFVMLVRMTMVVCMTMVMSMIVAVVVPVSMVVLVGMIMPTLEGGKLLLVGLTVERDGNAKRVNATLQHGLGVNAPTFDG